MKMTQLHSQDVTNSPKDWDDFWYNSTPINTNKVTTKDNNLFHKSSTKNPNLPPILNTKEYQIMTDKVYKKSANPNASNSELDAKIVINHNNMNDQDYLNLIQLIKDNPHTKNDKYWHNVVNKLYTKVNTALTNKRNRL